MEKKGISCAHQALFSAGKKPSLKQRGLCTIDINSKKLVYRISLWPYKHDRCRTFWTNSRSRYSRNNWKIRNMVLADRRLKVRKIVEAIGISHGSVISILKDHLAMKNYSQDGYRLCSQSTINAIVWQLRSNVWRCSTARDQAAVQRVGFAGWISAEEGQSGFVSQ